MSKHLHRDLDHLHRQILTLSAMVEEMIDKSIAALSDHRRDLVDEVVASDNTVDQMEVVIEEECLKILALHQPVAADLRRIATVMKVNGDLERIADLAVSIAERAKAIQDWGEFPIPDRMKRMVDITTQMVRSSLDAFVNLDAASAKRILRLDDEVDQHNRDIIAELQSLMQQQPELVVPALHCFSATRHIERIADHATNIAEDVIYLAEGEIVRHKKSDTA